MRLRAGARRRHAPLRAFWPLCPRVDVLPMPDPMPLPTRLRCGERHRHEWVCQSFGPGSRTGTPAARLFCGARVVAQRVERQQPGGGHRRAGGELVQHAAHCPVGCPRGERAGTLQRVRAAAPDVVSQHGAGTQTQESFRVRRVLCVFLVVITACVYECCACACPLAARVAAVSRTSTCYRSLGRRRSRRWSSARLRSGSW